MHGIDTDCAQIVISGICVVTRGVNISIFMSLKNLKELVIERPLYETFYRLNNS